MPGWNGKRIASYGLLAGLALGNAGLMVACHHHSTLEDNSLQPPILSYPTPTILATQGQIYAGAAPDVSAYVVTNGVGSTTTSGFTFTVSPTLPSGLTLGQTTGVISGIPSGTSPSGVYTITASNDAGYTTFPVTLGVQASSPVTLGLASGAAVSTAVNGSVNIGPGLPKVTATDDPVAATGYGVSPALPAGLTLGTTSGVVSGYATTAVPFTTYTLTATTPTGSADTTFSLLVVSATTGLAAPGALAYPVLSPATAGTAYAGPAPSVGGNPVDSSQDLLFTVVPDKTSIDNTSLPSGMTLDPRTGILGGTPTVAATLHSPYTLTISASNAMGTISTTASLTVQ